MFFKQVTRNMAKNRKNNGLFYSGLIIAIIAFYTLLSLEKQDVFVYLATIESNAVKKILQLIPILYIISLFFLFFLVYFACKYQMDSRQKEFGMYFMLGMKRSRLFFMLFCETLGSSLFSLLIGLPIAIFLSELVSFFSGKMIEFNINNHQFSLSANAMFFTFLGVILVQLFAMAILCIPIAKAEPYRLLHPNTSLKHTLLSTKKSSFAFIAGILFLIIAYITGIKSASLISSGKPYFMGVLILLFACGIAGTFLVYYGLGGFLGNKISKNSSKKTGLYTFTGRQVQESVVKQSKVLALSCLTLLVALSCIAFGVAIGLNRSDEQRSADFTLYGTNTEIEAVLAKPEIKEMTAVAYPVYISNAYYSEDAALNYDTTNLSNIITNLGDKTFLFSNTFNNFHIMSLSSYNALLSSINSPTIELGENEVAMYTNMGKNTAAEFQKVLEQNPTIGINDTTYSFYPTVCTQNIVASRGITLYVCLIVNDALYQEISGEPNPFGWNLQINKTFVDKLGLTNALLRMEDALKPSGLVYESYLSGIGRNLFYTTTASYLTLYLGILFLVVANAVIGIKYLIELRENKKRYSTLLMLGATTYALAQSAKKQIQLFFNLVLTISCVSGIFAIFTLLGMLFPQPKTFFTFSFLFPIICAYGAIILFEFIYIFIVKKIACREINSITITDLR